MKLKLKELVIFSMLGTLLWVSKLAMEFLPNIHLLAAIILAITAVYRQKALYPIYIFVLLLGVTNGFPLWWWPHLYEWTVLWGVAMLLPRRHPLSPLWYMLTGAGHGLVYGILYAPSQVFLFGMPWNTLPGWIVAGLPFDALHAAGNFFACLLTVPLIRVMQRAEQWTR